MGGVQHDTMWSLWHNAIAKAPTSIVCLIKGEFTVWSCFSLSYFSLNLPLNTLQPWHQRPSRGPLKASHLMEASHRVAQGWAARWISRWPLEACLLWAYFLYYDPPLCLPTFNFTDSGLQHSTWCLHTASFRGEKLVSSQMWLDSYRRHPPFCADPSFPPEAHWM